MVGGTTELNQNRMNWIKVTIANLLLRHLFNAVTENDFLKYDGTHLSLGDKPLSQLQVAELQNAAETLQRMNLEQLLNREMRYAANHMIFNKSKTTDDLIFGKALLYAIELREKKINQIAKLQ